LDQIDLKGRPSRAPMVTPDYRYWMYSQPNNEASYRSEELIKHNSKVQAYNKDFLLNFELIYNSDIVFIDAPWGGSIYKDKKNVSIYLQPENDYYNINDYDSSKNIITITKKILNKKYNVKSVMLKVPYNYEFDNFEKELNLFNSNIIIKYKKIYKGNTNYIAFVLIIVYIKN
jgi:hypothetical protein